MEKLRPIMKPAGVPLMQAVRGSSLTSAAVEALIKSAQLISEGLVDSRQEAKSYSGSSLLSIDMRKPIFAMSTDKVSLQRLREMLEHSVLFRSKILRIARAEAERRAAPHLLTTMEAQTDFRIDDKTIMIDIVVDCGVAAPVSSRDRVEGADE